MIAFANEVDLSAEERGYVEGIDPDYASFSRDEAQDDVAEASPSTPDSPIEDDDPETTAHEETVSHA